MVGCYDQICILETSLVDSGEMENKFVEAEDKQSCGKHMESWLKPCS
jgi:hypothetical protein